MRCLLIDGGNTRIKWALVENNQWLESGLVEYRALSFWKPPGQLDRVGWLCVGKEEHLIENTIVNWAIPEIRLRPPYKDGLVLSKYNLKELGPDRYSIIAGVISEWKSKPVVVISLGTCLTMDFCANGEHQGGFITPGFTMRLTSMHHFTGKLPLLAPAEGSWQWPGLTTAEAMQDGVRHGMAAEMLAFVAKAAEQYPDPDVVLCGGDTPAFENAFQKPIFARPQLVLQGLAAIILNHDTTP